MNINVIFVVDNSSRIKTFACRCETFACRYETFVYRCETFACIKVADLFTETRNKEILILYSLKVFIKYLEHDFDCLSGGRNIDGYVFEDDEGITKTYPVRNFECQHTMREPFHRRYWILTTLQHYNIRTHRALFSTTAPCF